MNFSNPKANWKIILIVLILTIFVAGGILIWRITEGREISNALKNHTWRFD